MKGVFRYPFGEYEILQTPCLWSTHQNYNYMVRRGTHVVIVDPGEGEPVRQTLTDHKLRVVAILLTHHHPDHVAATTQIAQEYSCPVWGFAGDQHRLPALTHTYQDQQSIPLLGLTWQALHRPGHTQGLCIFWVAQQKWLFANDLLFSLGCGRIFEGTYEQMWESLKSLRQLPEDTWVFSSHEYTRRNLEFSLGLLPDDPVLNQYAQHLQQSGHQQIPTVPFRLGEELQRNLFFRTREQELVDKLDIASRGDLKTADPELIGFTKLRQLRNQF